MLEQLLVNEDEGVVHLHKKQWHLEICMRMDSTRIKHPEQGNPDPERQTRYILTHEWILDIKQRITSL